MGRGGAFRLVMGTWLWLALLLPWVLPSVVSAADPVTVNIIGLSPPLEKNVRAMLTMVRKTADDKKDAIDLAVARAPDEIRTALQPFGYYRPKISASVTRQKNQWVAEYRIDPGAPIHLSRVEVKLDGEANLEPEMRVLVEKFPLKPGDVLDHVLYERGRDALEEQA
ncbi:MAG: hypothetical protein RL661_133, partial [Pseudomonadota bacterium]